jgi:small subunit ribosomal protein S8
MITDPIADYLTRIRNAARAKHSQTVRKYEVKENGKFKDLVVEIQPWVKEPLSLKRVSKPGQRIYLKTKEIKAVKNGLGVLILSTPKGVMSGEEARKNKLGGEVICEAY